MAPKIKEMALLERPREKIEFKGVTSLSNGELLAVLIGSGSKKESAIEVANNIINFDKEEGIRGLFNVSIEELKQIKGVGLAKACKILACIELCKRIYALNSKDRSKVLSPQDIIEFYMNELRYLRKEIFKIILLNTKNEIICDVDISIGSLNSSIVHPREVFIEAIKRSANKIILLHNHPSGNPNPSEEDKKITQRLIEGGILLGIEVVDHIIIGDGKYISFREKLFI